jgi:hypothetical protein
VKASYDDVAKLLARNASYLRSLEDLGALRSKKKGTPWDVDMAGWWMMTIIINNNG